MWLPVIPPNSFEGFLDFFVFTASLFFAFLFRLREPNDVPELERGEAFFIVRLGIFSPFTFKKAPAACEVRLHLAVINHIAACVNVNPHLISHLSAVMPGFQ